MALQPFRGLLFFFCLSLSFFIVNLLILVPDLWKIHSQKECKKKLESGGVRSRDLKSGVVRSKELKSGGIRSHELESGVVRSQDLESGGLRSQNLESGGLRSWSQGVSSSSFSRDSSIKSNIRGLANKKKDRALNYTLKFAMKHKAKSNHLQSTTINYHHFRNN